MTPAIKQVGKVIVIAIVLLAAYHIGMFVLKIALGLIVIAAILYLLKRKNVF